MLKYTLLLIASSKNRLYLIGSQIYQDRQREKEGEREIEREKLRGREWERWKNNTRERK